MIGITRVLKRARIPKANEAKNFPKTSEMLFVGRLKSRESVAFFLSSAQSLIVTAGTNTIKIKGREEKKGLIVATPDRKKVVINRPQVTNIKTTIKQYAIGELK